MNTYKPGQKVKVNAFDFDMRIATEGEYIKHVPEERAKRPDREQIARAILPYAWEPGDPDAAEHQRLSLEGADRVLALEPEARETEVVEFNDGPAFRSKGMIHTLTVAPTPGGWLVTCEDFRGEASCNLPSSDALKLAQMLHPEAH